MLSGDLQLSGLKADVKESAGAGILAIAASSLTVQRDLHLTGSTIIVSPRTISLKAKGSIHVIGRTTMRYAYFFQVVEAIAEAKETSELPAVFGEPQISYADLNSRANQLAHFLLNKKNKLSLPDGAVVGLFFHQSIDYVVSLLAVMKAGLAFMPLSANLKEIPDERLVNYVKEVKDETVRVSLLLTHSSLKSRPFLASEALKTLQLPPFMVDEIKNITTALPATNPNVKYAFGLEQLAYVHNTSGSTGVPKKILIKHRGLYNCMQAGIERMMIRKEDHVAAFADLAFDAHIFEMMVTLGAGACLYPIPTGIRTDFIKLKHFYNTHRMTASIFTPSMLRELKPADFSSLRVILSTGEEVTKAIVKKWQPADRSPLLFINGYGPAEVTIATSMAVLKPDEEVHIGDAIPGLRMLVLEQEAKLPHAPQRVEKDGELYIAGEGLGSYANVKLNAERFIEITDPDNPSQKIQVYRTGDAAELRAGKFYLKGRLDRQLKFYGKLIYPQEVEEQLTQPSNNIRHAYIDTCGFSDTKKDPGEHPYLTAYIELQNKNQAIDLCQIYYSLADKLTASMIPSRWVVVDNMPLNASKKIDAKALKVLPAAQHPMRLQGASEIKISEIKSTDNLEAELADLWREILKEDKNFIFYIDDNFFQLGGTSLQQANLLAELRSRYNLQLSQEEFLHAPTIATLARRIRRSLKKLPAIPDVTPLMDVKLENNLTPLFLIHSLMGDPKQDYEKLKSYLSQNRQIYVIRARGLNNPHDMDDSLAMIAADYIQAIRKIQPCGPYLLGGWSAGGVIAYAMAEQLQNKNEEVAVLMIDSVPLNTNQARTKEAFAAHLLDLFSKKLAGRLEMKRECAMTIEALVQKSPLAQTHFIFKYLLDRLGSETGFSTDIANINPKRALLVTVRDTLLAMLNYRMKDGLNHITLFAASRTQEDCKNEHLNWPAYSKIEKIIKLEGNHESIVLDPNSTPILAKHINRWCMQYNIRITLIERLENEAVRFIEDETLKKQMQIFLSEAKKKIKQIQETMSEEAISYNTILSTIIKEIEEKNNKLQIFIALTIPDLDIIKSISKNDRAVVQAITNEMEEFCKKLRDQISSYSLLASRRLRDEKATFSIGHSDYKIAVMQEGNVLVDKTLFIKEIIDDGAQVKLILRPRRFGKTFNMSMLKYFFEKTTKKDEHVGLFDTMAIWNEGMRYRNELGQYPVLFITLKDIKANNFEMARQSFLELLANLYQEYKKLLFDSIFKDDIDEQKNYQKIINRQANGAQVANALKNLTGHLRKVFDKRVIVLIDEYDTPINTSYEYQYYPQMVDFMRGILSPLLKDNKHLHQAVLTGILRIAKESIFSGLNNVCIYSALSNQYSTCFGFLAKEVQGLLKASAMPSDLLDKIESWYGGYQMATEKIFNPWSIINFIAGNRNSSPGNIQYKSYWLNTAENKLIEDLFMKAGNLVPYQNAIRNLLNNKSIVQEICDHTIFDDIATQSSKRLLLDDKQLGRGNNSDFQQINDNNHTQALWSFLFLSGYLTVKPSSKKIDEEKSLCELVIPNKELYGFYKKIKIPDLSSVNYVIYYKILVLYLGVMSVLFYRTPNLHLKEMIANELIKWLQIDKETSIRCTAIEVLGRIFNSDQEVVNRLLMQLKNRNSEIRRAAVEILGSIPSVNKEIINKLIKQLQNETPTVRLAIVKTLGNISNLGEDVINKLIDEWRNKDSDVRRAVIEALGKLPNLSERAINKLIDSLQEEKYSDSYIAMVEMLGKIPNPSKHLINKFVDELEHVNCKVRYAAIQALGKIPNLRENVINKLVAGIQDRDSDVRRTVVEVLGKIPNLSEDVINKLVAGIQDKDSHVRRTAAEVLGKISNLSDDVINKLESSLQDEKDPDSRTAMIETLGKIPNLRETVINKLVDELGYGSWKVRHSAIQVLSKIPNLGESVMHRLVAGIQDMNTDLRLAVVEVLGKLPKLSESVIHNLVDKLKNENLLVSHAAIEVLIKIPNPNEIVINKLVDRLQDEKDSEVRSKIVEALGKLRHLNSDAISKLVNGLNDESWSVRYEAVQALGRIASIEADVISKLVKMQDKDSAVRQAVIEVLGKLPHLDKNVMNKLLDGLKDEEPLVRSAAVQALGNTIPGMDDNVIDHLKERIKDENWLVRFTAIEILEKIPTLDGIIINQLIDLLPYEKVFAKDLLRKSLLKRYKVDNFLLSDHRKIFFQTEPLFKKYFGGPTLMEMQDLTKEMHLNNIPINQISMHHSSEWLPDQYETSFMRKAILDILEKFPHQSIAVISKLIAFLNNKDALVRAVAIEALEKIPNPSQEVIEGCLVKLQDEQSFVQRAAASFLRNIHNPSETVVRRLISRLGDKDFEVRKAAAETIKIWIERGDELDPKEYSFPTELRNSIFEAAKQGLAFSFVNTLSSDILEEFLKKKGYTPQQIFWGMQLLTTSILFLLLGSAALITPAVIVIFNGLGVPLASAKQMAGAITLFFCAYNVATEMVQAAVKEVIVGVVNVFMTGGDLGDVTDVLAIASRDLLGYVSSCAIMLLSTLAGFALAKLAKPATMSVVNSLNFFGAAPKPNPINTNNTKLVSAPRP